MNPEREFLLTAFSRYLDQNPHEARKQALDMCEKYLTQNEKTIRLEEHCQLLEEKINEQNIDYKILRIELEIEQRKHLSPRKSQNKQNAPQLPFFHPH